MGLRVLHIGKFFPPYMGGMEVFLSDLIHAQRAQGIEAFALVHGTPSSADPEWLIRVPVQFNLVYAPIAAGFRSALGKAIRNFQPDILHLHLPNNSALWALTLPAARKVPCVVHWHSDVVMSDIKWSVALAYFLYRPFEYAVLDRSHKIFATSPPYLAASPPLQLWKDKCSVVPLGTSIPSLSGEHKLPPDLQWSEGTEFKLLSIGRLTYYKGFETLIRAVQAMPGVELLIAGSGELQASLEAIIRETTPAGLAPRVRLIGAVKEADKHALLQACDTFCLASRERTEAFGIVLLEAMMHQKPCIVTDLPGSGMPWVVAHARAGLHVPLEDLDGWRSAIARLQHDPALRLQLGASGHRALLEKFDIRQCERLIASHYLQLSPLPPQKVIPGSLLVVLSTHNHAQHIQAVVAKMRAQTGGDVLVVDSNSTDATRVLAEKAGAQVITPLIHLTAWGRLQTGIRHALARGYEHVLTIDTEGQYAVEELSALLAQRQSADVVIAHFATRHSFVRRAAWQWFRWITGLSVGDVVSSCRLYNRAAMEVAASAEATLLDYQDIGTLLLLERRGLTFVEVPLHASESRVDQSGIFRSWAKAIRYVAASTLLGIAGRRRARTQRRHPPPYRA